MAPLEIITAGGPERKKINPNNQRITKVGVEFRLRTPSWTWWRKSMSLLKFSQQLAPKKKTIWTGGNARNQLQLVSQTVSENESEFWLKHAMRMVAIVFTKRSGVINWCGAWRETKSWQASDLRNQKEICGPMRKAGIAKTIKNNSTIPHGFDKNLAVNLRATLINC